MPRRPLSGVVRPLKNPRSGRTRSGRSFMRWKLAVPWLAVLFVGPAHRPDPQDQVRAVIEKAIQAHGGEEKLTKVKAVRAKSKGTIHFGGASSPYTNAESWQLPDRIKVVLDTESQGQKLR